MNPRSLRVLAVEDSEDDAELLLIELRRAGWAPTFQRVQTRADMESALDQQPWDIVISDYHMPHFSALGALGLLRERRLDLPFIILSGAIGEETAVASMKAGAHDYIMKGNLARLLPAIERELRDAGERSARRQAEGALSQSEERYRTIVDTANDAIVTLDEHGRVTFVNRRMPALLGYDGDELLGRDLGWVIHEADREEWRRRLVQLQGGARLLFDVRLRRKDGGQLWALNSCTPLFDESGAFSGAIAMLKDVTERKQAEEALAHQALHDALTGLPNRTLLHDRLEQALRAARRDHRQLSVLLIDLDRFKEVNDAFGHQYGDLLLKQVGPRLTAALRESDTVARLGGDEFAVILSSCGLVEDAKLAATKVLAALEQPFVVEDQSLFLAASVGVVIYPEHGADALALMRRADVAMYAAKRDGGGFALFASEQDQQNASRLALTNQLRQAIEQDELEAFYQPKISLLTQELVGVEALARWRHPRLGLIAPDHFIPLAEQTGLIKPLSERMLSAVLRQSQRWQAGGLNIPVAVNLSMRNLHDPNLPDVIARLLAGSGVPANMLQVEITETVLMTNPTRALDVVTRLSAMGIDLSIDDFGTGYSSLAYLKRLPVREIKIDQSFVRDMTSDENDAVIVRSTIDLGHNLGLKVVAEGVEDQPAWDQLVALGCDLAQGYYMGKPMCAADLERWLVDSRGIARRDYVAQPA